MDVDALKAQGYRPPHVTHVTATGERREATNYELWWKESRDQDRRAYLCVVPKREGAGYNWRMALYLDAKETWAFESGAMYGKPSGLRLGIDCTVSPALGEGRLRWRVWYSYWQ